MLSVESSAGVSLNHELARKRPFFAAACEDRRAVDTGLIRSAGDDFENGKHKLASTTKLTVARRIGYTVGSLTYRFPDLCAKLVARLPERKLFLHQQQSAVIRLALSEESVPSLKSIAGRVGMTAPYLRTLHPDVCAQIQKGQTDRKNKLASIKRAAFQEEIRAAVLNLSQLGIAPSRKRVFDSIRNPSLRSTKILDRQIAVTKLEVQVASGAWAPAATTETPVCSAGNHPLAVQDWNHNLA